MNFSVEQDLTTCAECAMAFTAPASFMGARRRDGKTFFCPAGHRLHFGGGDFEKLRRERDRLQQRVAYESDRASTAEAEAEHARHVANGHKGFAAKLRKRAGAGVCPCCNRTFSALARHMAAQHPTFAKEVVKS